MCRLFILLLIVLPLHAATLAPSFGPSIQFPDANSSFTIKDLSGRPAVVIFFQSWCPICNGWSGELIHQIEKAYSDSPWVLVAIKTDGGGVDGARAYMEKQGATLDRWQILADQKAVYYAQFMEDTPLWGSVVIDPGGSVIQIKKAGMFYSKGGAKVFSLAQDRGKFEKAFTTPVAPRLQLEGDWVQDIPGLQSAMQRGSWIGSFNALGNAKKAKVAAADEGLGALRAKLAAHLQSVIADCESTDMETKLSAFCELLDLDDRLGKLDELDVAKDTLKALKRDKVMKNEYQAYETYQKFNAMIAQVPSDQQADARAKAKKAFLKKFADTVYGQRVETQW